MASVQPEESCLSSYRKLLLKLSSDLTSNDLEKLKFAAVDFIPRGRTENIGSGIQFFDVLEQDLRIGPQNLGLLQEMFETIGRVDLAQKVQPFSTAAIKVEADGSSSGLMGAAPAGLMGPAPAGLMGPAPAGLMGPAPAGLMGPAPSALMGPAPAELMGPAPAPALAPAPSLAKHAGAQQRGAQGHSSGRVQHDSSIGPAPVRYVNFLTFEGYTVKIIGGKHFKTPEGEFVEMKSGTQYQIHVKNTRAYGCNLDVSIDGYNVGGWTVDGGDELSIERPAYEPKKFTFYRVKTAPKEAGIESGGSENGVVKCVFTPEAFFDVPVIISGSSQPLNVNIPPSATVGDLKEKKSFLSALKEKFGWNFTNQCPDEGALKEMETASNDSPEKLFFDRHTGRIVVSRTDDKGLIPLHMSAGSQEGFFGHPLSKDEIYDMSMESAAEQRTDRVTEPDPAWRAGGTTLQGYSTQQFTTADPIKVDHSRKVELVVRLVAREDEEDLVFPKDECKPLSTLYPPAVPE